jgi:DNA-directed RNA polymerase sigma subunit (sigma70/sigma32)
MIHELQNQKKEGLDVLRSRLFLAMENLDQATLKLLVRRFGLDGEEPISQEELATSLGISMDSVVKLEAEALRVLIGYGKYPGKKNVTVEQ